MNDPLVVSKSRAGHRPGPIDLALVLLALLPGLATPWLGWIGLVISVALLGALVLRSRGTGATGKAVGIALGGLGGVVGVGSAVGALSAHAGETAYAVRAWAGWAALTLAIGAAVAVVLASRRPVLGAVAVGISALLGVVAINLYDINTIYLLAVPFWLLGALLTARR